MLIGTCQRGSCKENLAPQSIRDLKRLTDQLIHPNVNKKMLEALFDIAEYKLFSLIFYRRG